MRKTKHNRKEEAAILHGSIRRIVPVLNPILAKNSSASSYNISRENIHFTKYVIETPWKSAIVAWTIGRAGLVFILRDVTRFTPLLARLVQ